MLRFGIAEKVKHIVRDTANNKVKAFKLPNYEHDLKEIDEDVSSLDHDVSFDEITSNDSDMLYMFPVEHHGCFAHVLQLVVKIGFKRPQIRKVIKKCSRIMCHVRKSTIARDSLDGEKTLKPAVATRWNSQLKML
uniref:Uncharacterized protein n=1 Tax=Amphimedon queenslandica TaxID=400682 RepID=A0A1X7UYZ4_AMPQE